MPTTVMAPGSTSVLPASQTTRTGRPAASAAAATSRRSPCVATPTTTVFSPQASNDASHRGSRKAANTLYTP
eukprot:CAMPEP_0181384998 /NCGR_PEP_ID=MMETSP1106-20121128/22297_1 /TAXON_ID=81844 /ORGANISM="Mantoniella antarctica, Strain SL-175" /LENGTH=71 /DNA_ID=CAMNT_0023504973 /DNA_START=81 /DNA_END=293 /DNA_ORIENTATION=+